MTIPAVRASESLSVSLSVTPVSAAQAARVARPPDKWAAADVIAYINEEILRVHGPQLPARDAQQVLQAFCQRFGIPVAVRIARAAFEVYGGMWQGAPVTWRRFSPSHDGFFARPILEALA
jgi:acetyl-CoA carboxylase alpha subunit